MTIERLQESEAQALVQLGPELKPHLDLTANAFNLIGELLAHIPYAAMKDLPPAVHVATKLLLRLSNDLRGIDLLTAHGYPLQALSVGAAAYEVAFAIGYIGRNDGRAQAWMEHDDPTKFMWDVRTMTRETLATFGVPDPAAQTNVEYRVYRQFCMAKHGNPLMEGRFGLEVRDGMVVMSNGPDVSESAIRAARFALEHAAGFAFIALVSFLQHHLSQYVSPEAFSLLSKKIDALGARRKELEAVAIARYGTEDPFPGRW